MDDVFQNLAVLKFSNLAVKSLMQLAAIDTPSGSTATSRYAADEIAMYGRGFWAKGR